MTMEERVGRLERRNRQLVMMLVTMVGVGVLVAIVASRAASAQEPLDEVWARRFVVVNDRGQPRAFLSDRSGGLAMSDAAGRVRIALTVEGDSPGLTLCDAAGQARASIGLLSDGSPGLRLTDAVGQACVVVGEDWLALCDVDGDVIWGKP